MSILLNMFCKFKIMCFVLNFIFEVFDESKIVLYCNNYDSWKIVFPYSVWLLKYSIES